MTQPIQAPDGSIVEFPDGMPDAQIAAVMAKNYPAPQSTFSDVWKSGLSGLAKGSAGMAGMVMDALPSGTLMGAARNAFPNAHIPTSADLLNQGAQDVFGQYHKPQTTAGSYAETIGEFAPGAIAGPEGLIPKAASVLVPALASETAGQITKGSPAEPAARMVGALLAPTAIGGGINVASKIANAYKPLAPEAANAQALGQLLKGYGGDSSASDISSFLSSNPSKPLAVMDYGGDNSAGARMARALVTKPGAQSPAITNFLNDRAGDQANRITDDITNHLAGGGDLTTLQNALMQGRQDAATPLYEAAYKSNKSIASPAIDRILATPAGSSALATARTMMQNDQSLMGTPDAELGQIARDQGITGTGGVAPGLNLRSLDYVKQALDDNINSQFRAGNNQQAGILVGLKNNLLKEIDNADVTGIAGPNSTKPGGGLYAQARAAWSGPTQSLNAISLGQDFLKPSNNPDALSAAIQNLDGPDVDFYKIGAARALQDKVASVGDNRNAAAAIFGNPAIRQKIQTVFGSDAADKFSNAMQAESGMNATRNFVLGGSQTANKLADETDPNFWQQIGEDAVKGFASGGPHGAIVSPAIGAAKRGGMAMVGKLLPQTDPAVSNKLAEMLMSSAAPDVPGIRAQAALLQRQNKQQSIARLLQYSAPALGVGMMQQTQ